MRPRLMRQLVVLSCVFVFFGVSLCASSALLKLRVKTAEANVRSGPVKTSRVLFVASSDAVFDSDGVSGDWYRVRLASNAAGQAAIGYIHRTLVEVVGEAQPKPQQSPSSVIAPPATTQREATAARPAPPPRSRRSQSGFFISLLGGAGVTFVDLAKDLDITPGWLLDWNKFHWRAVLQGVYRFNSRMGFGASFGFNSLYYYYWKAPYYTGHEGTVNAWSVHALLEYRPTPRLFLQVGPGLFLYRASSAFGFFAALGADIPIARNIAIPVMVRFDEAPGAPSPLALLTGIRIGLN